MEGKLDFSAAEIDPLGALQSVHVTEDYDATLTAATVSLGMSASEPEVKYPSLPIRLQEGERPLLYRGPDSVCVVPCSVLTASTAVAQASAVPTSYRFVVVPHEPNFCFSNRLRSDFFEVPLGLLQKCERSQERDCTVLELVLKDGRILRVGFRAEDCANLYPLLVSAAFPQHIRSRFAFSHQLKGAEDGWQLYDCEREFARMGVSADTWQLVNNSDWKLCASYPQRFFAPRGVIRQELEGCARFRTRGRLPALVWTQPGMGALYRSSQPMSGIRTNRSLEDERFLKALIPQGASLVVFDARPFLNAQANRAVGGGVENPANYESLSVEFLHVVNIHGVRDSYVALQACNSAPDNKYLSAVERSGWLDHLGSLLAGAMKVVGTLQERSAALVHCTDGWDRTAQLCSLAQICVDSYYRSLRGFAVLVEKDWLAFGHQFDRRLGHCVPAHDEQSPVFLQFLDAVHQLTQQFPTHFEFSSRLLVDLAFHAHSGCFGTFMCNNDQERAACNLRVSTPSIWTYVLLHSTDYTNPFFQPGQDEVLQPVDSPRRMQIWHEVFSKWHADMFYPWLDNATPDEHKEVLMRHAQEGLSQYKKLLLEKDAEIQQLQTQLLESQGYASVD